MGELLVGLVPVLRGIVPTLHPSMFSAPVPYSNTFAATVPVSGLRATMIGSQAGLRAVPNPSHSPCKLWLFGNPLFPVIKTLPLRLATKAPVLTVGQNISPVYSVAVTVAKEAL